MSLLFSFSPSCIILGCVDDYYLDIEAHACTFPLSMKDNNILSRSPHITYVYYQACEVAYALCNFSALSFTWRK